MKRREFITLLGGAAAERTGHISIGVPFAYSDIYNACPALNYMNHFTSAAGG